MSEAAGSAPDETRESPEALDAPEKQSTKTEKAEKDRFPPLVSRKLDKAAQWCTARGGRLTQTRRLVLGLILASPKPLGAYELLAQLRETQPKAVPPTVYRALDFLLGQRLVHRIERLSAFVGCPHVLDCQTEACCGADETSDAQRQGAKESREWPGHRAQFLICRACGRAQELEQDLVSALLLKSARGQGFVAESATVEIMGLCAACTASSSDPLSSGDRLAAR